MKVLIGQDSKEIGKISADIISKEIKNKPDMVLGLATGSTPLGTYRELIEKYDRGEIDFSKVKTFNLDEYYPIKKEDENSYNYYMWDNLFNHVNVKRENVNIPDGTVNDPNCFCEKYENMIDEAGGIDLQILGIGVNGHIGFNEPSENLSSKTNIVELKSSTRDANSRFFSSIDDVPTHAITMGMGSIFKARKILLLASGESKADAIKKVLSGKITTSCPATLLNLHNNVTLIIDKDVLNKVK